MKGSILDTIYIGSNHPRHLLDTDPLAVDRAGYCVVSRVGYFGYT